MDASQIVLKLALDEIGLEFGLVSFGERLALQKKIYLAQLTGADLGYRFRWYVHGPYSPSLTDDAFRLRDDLDRQDDDFESEELNDRVRKQLSGAKTIWGTAPPGVEECDWLELLASLHYLKHIAYFPATMDVSFDRVFTSLVSSKPRFADRRDDARLAWDHLEEVGLVENKTLAVA